jgi:molybdopterin synthase sulfur carrier subunit
MRYVRIPNMTSAPDTAVPDVGSVTVHYWGAARAAAGVESDEVPVGSGATLADVLASALALHADRPRLASVVRVCSVLLGDRPVASADPAEVVVAAGATVELLPPFAGG